MASDLKISTLTVHLAIKLLDHFMSGHDIEEAQLFLVCLGCLQLASKVIEKASRIQCGLVPSWPTNVATVSGYSNEQIDSVTDSLVSLHKLHSDDENMLDEGYQSNLSSGLSPEKLLPSQ